ncbi:energy transducer TonB [Pseudoalteromonas luteoviolacea]|uniref:TonB C-terminal domain-containing protein n=1 Tax=Pseudoalteromonas luteoviolacea S4054 TaxID=1129367 RepID=A0A0F6AF92_9GAMM|nr:energy transducer TonB [Pseudoalteromonas luteoviolacea]AOT10046.1 hypothetical protein S4054249_20495 [Pseudoalteromonas luteoviolacea]AOT14957.1 hypothetical protein S40542_20465 [Pseudoalteromonas luteoviolacea]AOT19873.1 hypothetical protein S4054_20470 [Pseudoalteromonas luteoviolacea]KKE84870.1 hypothetical protein N479_07170 [Pseudoalteromonas luteoviolacea S4054]KZN72487.1 hypothetical protein N481_14760 [Pseudoalteromonas luteoviolacea S4047-1]
MLTRRDWLFGFIWALGLHLAILGIVMWGWQPHTPAQPNVSTAPFVVKLAPLAKAASQSQELHSSQAQSASIPTPLEPQNTTATNIGLAHDGRLDIAKKPEPKAVDPAPKPETQKQRAPKKTAELAPQKPQPIQQPDIPKHVTDQPEQQESIASAAKEIQADAPAQQNQAQQQGQDTQLALVAAQNWQAQLIAHLAKKKRYPTMARKRRQEATVMVSFVIDDKGQAQYIEVVQASRYPLLNKEAKSVVKRAQPLPLPPENMLNNKVMVPVRFYLL